MHFAKQVNILFPIYHESMNSFDGIDEVTGVLI